MMGIGCRRWLRLGLIALGMTGALAPGARAQLVTTLVNRDGATIPCVTVGPLAPVAQEYCVRRTLKFGWLRKSEMGYSGLSVDDGGRVSAVTPGSAAASAGVRVGDQLLGVDGHPLAMTPAESAERAMFGAADGVVRLSLTRAGQPLERSLKRAHAPEPADAPRSPNILLGIHPLMNWRGEMMPCMGAGALGPVAVAGCTSRMQRFGFVRTDALGETGIAFDPARTDAALISSVAPGSPAAAADVAPGDVVTAVDGKALDPDRGHNAQVLLFGKAGETRRLSLERAGRQTSVDLTLGGAP